MPAGGDDADDGGAGAGDDAAERAAGWAHKVLATVQADLVTVKVPVGEARLSLCLFEWDERSLHVAQQVPALAHSHAHALAHAHARAHAPAHAHAHVHTHMHVHMQMHVHMHMHAAAL